MIDDTDFFMTAPDGLEIFVRHSRAEDAEGVVVISHGMAEHSGRYSHVAEALVEAGYHVYIPDHRGHGLTAARAKDEEKKPSDTLVTKTAGTEWCAICAG